MITLKKFNTLENLNIYQKTALFALAFSFMTLLFYLFPTPSEDWRILFYPAAKTPFNPYTIRTFNYPPWTVFIVYPLSFFSLAVSQAANISLNLVIFGLLVKYRKGTLLALLLTLTSYPFLTLISNGNVEWIPALGYLIPNGFGFFLLLTKPQSGSLAAIDWFLKSKNKIWFVLIPAIGVICSFFLWKNWVQNFWANQLWVNKIILAHSSINFSLFPWTIPLGIVLLYYVVKVRGPNSELYGCLATFCLVPYFSVHSLIIPFALLSARYPRIAIAVSILLWLIPFLFMPAK